MRRLNKQKQGFTLIEAIIALGLLTVIAVFLLPSLGFMVENSRKTRNDSKIIYALEAAIESEKIKGPEIMYGVKDYQINGVEVRVSRSKHSDNLDKIRAISGNYELELLEVVNEKAWFYPN